MAVEGPCRVAEGEGPAKKNKEKMNRFPSGELKQAGGKGTCCLCFFICFFGTVLNETSKKSTRKVQILSFASLHAKEAICDLQVSLSIAVSSNHPTIVCASEVFFMAPTLLLLAAKSSGS